MAIYFFGMLVLAFGITLSTRLGLGTSPVSSVTFCISEIFQLPFGDVTMMFYLGYVAVQILLHLAMKPDKEKLRNLLVSDILQLPVNYPLTRFMNYLTEIIPDFEQDMAGSFAGSMTGRFLLLILSILMVGLGAAFTLSMRIVPNPADGIVQAISDHSHIKLGNVKNMFDAACVLITLMVGWFGAHRIIGLGIGSIMAMAGTGRVIALVNRFFDPAPFLGEKQV